MVALDTVFHQVAVVLVVCAAIAVLATRLRQPPIVGFIIAGILVGPQGFGLVDDPAEIELLAKIGISLLLFVVGLRLDVRIVRTVGPVALATGLGQVLFTSVIGYALARTLGLDPVAALYVAVALTFSSTIIIVKLLSDKRETEDLHGRIAIGLLIVQDIVVVLVMIGLTAFGDPDPQLGIAAQFGVVALTGAAFLGAILVCMRWVLPPLLHRLAHNPELLVLFAITWAIGLAVAGDLLGFSEEVGAFLAGVSIASTPYREAIGGRLVALRDFLVLFFFIQLGSSLELGHAGELLVPAIVLSLFVLIGNPLIVLVIMGAMGYRKRVSFLTGLTVAQISEFSLILAALGATLGHIEADIVGLITTVGLITIGLSTYLIYNSHALCERLTPLLGPFERATPRSETLPETHEEAPEVVIVGLGRFGSAILQLLRERGVEVFGVDFDPEALRAWSEEGVSTTYGDAEDPELPEGLPLGRARWVVSTSRSVEANLSLLQALRQHGFRGKVAVSADSDGAARRLADAGADQVLVPFSHAAGHAADLLR